MTITSSDTGLNNQHFFTGSFPENLSGCPKIHVAFLQIGQICLDFLVVVDRLIGEATGRQSVDGIRGIFGTKIALYTERQEINKGKPWKRPY